MSILSLNPIHFLLKQETFPSLLSTGWFQEQVRVGFTIAIYQIACFTGSRAQTFSESLLVLHMNFDALGCDEVPFREMCNYP